MKDTKLTMVRGDTLAFGVEIEGLDQDLATAYFSCKNDPNDDKYVFQKKLNDGISKVETGKYRVRGCTVHFPAAIQAKIETMTGYPNFGGTNTTVLFDL